MPGRRPLTCTIFLNQNAPHPPGILALHQLHNKIVDVQLSTERFALLRGSWHSPRSAATSTVHDSFSSCTTLAVTMSSCGMHASNMREVVHKACSAELTCWYREA